MGYLPYDVTLKAFFWIITICFLALDGLLFLIKASKISKKDKLQKELFRALSFFLFLNIGVGLFFILSDFERNIFGTTDLYYRLLASAYIFAMAAFLAPLYIAEREITNPITKFLLSIVTLIVIGINIVFLIFFPNLIPIIRYIDYCLWGAEVVILFLAYMYIIKESSGDLKKIAILTLIGFGVAACAAILQIDIFISTGLIAPYYSPILFTIGLIFFAYIFLKMEALDVIEMVVRQIYTTISEDFWENLEKLDLIEISKEEFVTDILALTPKKREEFMKMMIEKFQKTE